MRKENQDKKIRIFTLSNNTGKQTQSTIPFRPEEKSYIAGLVDAV